jgi:hypothetical protein
LKLTENEGDSCSSPSDENGICKRIKSCPVLFEIFSNKPVSPENAELLRDSLCSEHQGGPIIVCCPNRKFNDFHKLNLNIIKKYMIIFFSITLQFCVVTPTIGWKNTINNSYQICSLSLEKRLQNTERR